MSLFQTLYFLVGKIGGGAPAPCFYGHGMCYVITFYNYNVLIFKYAVDTDKQHCLKLIKVKNCIENSLNMATCQLMAIGL